MTIDIAVQKNGSTYIINKNGKQYTAKDNDGDGLLSRKDGNIDGITEKEWAAIEKYQAEAQAKSAESSKLKNNCANSTFSGFASLPFSSGGNIWSYETMCSGYPSDALSAANDTAVWNYASNSANMTGMFGKMFCGVESWLRQMEISNNALLEAMKSRTAANTPSKTEGGSGTGTTEEEKVSVSKEKLEAARKEIERLQKELEESKKVKSHRDVLTDTSKFDANVERIAEKLRNKMKGLNLSSIFGNMGNDKAVADTVNEIKPENVVEVMDYYKSEICDKNRMGDDFNLIESIYDDFTKEKYTTKITQIENALVTRAQALIDKYGDEIGITAQDIAQFKSDVNANQDADGMHVTGDSAPIAKTFEDFKNLIQKVEGNQDTQIVKKSETTEETTKNTTVTTSEPAVQSSTVTSSTTERVIKEKIQK